MTSEQMERRLRAIEQSTKGLDYVRTQDELDAAEDAENEAKSKSKKKSNSEDTSAE